MDSNKSDRRRFLKQAAGLAGVAAGAGLVTAKGQPASAQAPHVHTEPPRRGARYSIDHMTHYTPLQDYSGIITPSRLHFVQYHASHFPDIDAEFRVQAALLIALAYRQPWHPGIASCVERVFELVQTGNDANLRTMGAAYLLAYGSLTGPISLSRRALPVLEALLRHPDVTALNAAWASYLISFFHFLVGNFDQSQNARLYRRDLTYNVEYATVVSRTLP
jgi:hypothetical protein